MRFAVFLVFFSISVAKAQHSGLSIGVRKVVNSLFTTKDSVISQEVNGNVIDRETHRALPGATILIRSETGKVYGEVSNEDGQFAFRRVPVGRYDLQVTYIGFHSVSQSFTLTSARAYNVQVPLEPSAIYLTEVSVKSSFQDLAPLGSNAIDPAQFKYHPGNRYESPRKVATLPGNYPADDSRNDLIIRGNSPQSVSWRIEGINVPNPNHFNIPGTSGGPVSIVNDKMLGVSQFYSGAFPAEYGNTTSGIFDLRFRNGDSTKFRGGLQFGFLGAEGLFEGPLSRKKKSTYIVSLRKSVFGLFNALNIDIGTASTPKYSDLSFKLHFPAGKNASFWIFGLGGRSSVDLLISKQDDITKNLYGEKDRDQYFSSDMFMTGVGVTIPFRRNGYFTHTLALIRDNVESAHRFVYPRELRRMLIPDEPISSKDLPPVLYYNFRESRISGSFFIARKLAVGSYVSGGITYDFHRFRHLDSTRVLDIANPMFGSWRREWDSNDRSVLLQPYLQWKYAADNLDILAGLHGQYFSLSKSKSIEPRLTFRYHLRNRASVNIGAGMHSQMHQPYLYFYAVTHDAQGRPREENRTMDFTRSIHTVTGFEKSFGSDSSKLRFKAEVYYQWLYNVPVERDRLSAFSLINAGADFRRQHPPALVNEGEGRNYGFECMIEKSFSKSYMFLVTGTYFKSRYTGSDDVWRNSDFNARFIFNILATREWRLKKQNVFSLGTKFTTAGGRWYGPEDLQASQRLMEVVVLDEFKNTKQFSPYYRFDLRLTYQVNLNKVTHEFSMDLINVFNTRNILKKTYVADAELINKGRVVNEYQLGFLPFFYYRVEF